MPAETSSGAVVPPTKPKRGMTARVLVALALGTALGLFFGELVGWLRLLGDAYVGLLQMTVLPYIVFSLTASIGRLTFAEGRKIATRGFVVLLFLWALGLAVVLVAPTAFPERPTGTFFRPDLTEGAGGVDFLDLFIPFNVFGSLSRNVVPAVVVFCIALGSALIGMDRKGTLLDVMDTASEALMRVNAAIVRFTPYGVFAIAAGTAGTMTLEDLGRLQAYLIVYSLAVLYLGLVLLPMLIAAVTPFTYRQILRASRDALVMAFATGKVLITLPMLIEGTKRMFEERDALDPETERNIDVMYPLAYPFPSLGKVVALMFVPFVAWFVGSTMGWLDYPPFLLAGLFSMFGGPVAAIPFLLEMQHLPADMMQLFLASGVWTARVGDLLSAMHLVAMAVLTTAWVAGMLRFRLARIVKLLAFSLGVAVVAVFGVRAWLAHMLPMAEPGESVLERLRLVASEEGLLVEDARILGADAAPPAGREGQATLDAIRERGRIRVGFVEDRLPWSWRNAAGKLVGFDVDMAHWLALDLQVGLDFVPVDLDELQGVLDAGRVDIVMSGLAGSLALAETVRTSTPYLDVRLALAVPDYRARELADPGVYAARHGLRVGALGDSELTRFLAEIARGIELVTVPSKRDFFEGRTDAEVLLLSAEGGAAWTLLYPRFRIVLTKRRVAVPAVYAVRRDDVAFDGLIDQWVDLKLREGTVDAIYQRWILGETGESAAPRWSVIRDVLGWID